MPNCKTYHIGNQKWTLARSDSNESFPLVLKYSWVRRLGSTHVESLLALFPFLLAGWPLTFCLFTCPTHDFILHFHKIGRMPSRKQYQREDENGIGRVALNQVSAKFYWNTAALIYILSMRMFSSYSGRVKKMRQRSYGPQTPNYLLTGSLQRKFYIMFHYVFGIHRLTYLSGTWRQRTWFPNGSLSSFKNSRYLVN